MENLLVLCDIDGNLVYVTKHHTLGYQKAIEEVYGIKLTFPDIEANYGRPARDCIEMPLREKGMPEEIISQNSDEVLQIYAKYLERGIRKASRESDVTLPGAIDMLKMIKSYGIPLGVVTGNIRIAGEAVLRGTSLYNLFDARINSYSDFASNRHEIVSNAIRSARELGLIDCSARVYVTGDTVHDITAARINKCISIAVIRNSNDEECSPGGRIYSQRKEILEKAQPDYLLDDYTDIEKIMSILGIE